MKDIHYSESFEQLWQEEAEIKTRVQNRLFCNTFLVCNPLSAIAFFLSGDPFFYTLLPAHMLSGSIILGYMFLNYRKVISGQQMSFYAFVTLICFYAFLLSRPHHSYVQSCINLTLAVIFAGLVLRWPLRYALIVSLLGLTLYPASIHFFSDTSLTEFFEQGAVFVMVAHIVFPFVVKLNYSKDKREFYFRYTLQQQNDALERQKTIAEQATRAKTDFLSMMSHEIRTPLNGIVGMVHLMIQEEEHSEKPNDLLNTLKFSADHLMAVVNDVLDFNKINSNHVILDPQPFNPFELFDILKKTFDPKANEKGISLVCSIDPGLPAQLVADRLRLSQVITNLVHNAIKFTANGSVVLEVKEVARTPEAVTIDFSVTDTGIGIPNAEQAGIFEIFTQVRARTHSDSVSGTGLGLAISRELMRLFDSEIHLESEEGKGSRFSFRLSIPYSEQPVAVSQPLPVAVAEDIPEVRVLVADDNKTNLVLATQLLKRKNILHDTASNGQEAYEMFRQNQYDLVLMDLRMPVMDGFESTGLIRQLDARVPIIALTASAFENEKERAMASGFSGYFIKPFIPQDFYDYIFPFLGIAST
ncbi:Signal transduction histidine kinase [Dyadobacter sp. SG02]|uniref:ATP-binding protein n=1 Tax=Dyadobacter sp. SG02 TaxID=1855291 RepID=UPI0008CF1D7B|nr:ATP-binding protein [Dyadobacter sp. SG02]SEJ12235.1 Signal transduction histidine kinase [Dyadobacter sp. SG02]